MSSNELFSDEFDAPEPRRSSQAARRPSGRKLGNKGVSRLILGLVLLIGTFAGVTAEAVLSAAPAFAAVTYTCTTPASGGTAATYYTGVANTGSVVCYGISGVTGTSAYPGSITVNTGSLPADAVRAPPPRVPPPARPAPRDQTRRSTTSSPVRSPTIRPPRRTAPIRSHSPPIPGTDGGSAGTSGTLTMTVSNTTRPVPTRGGRLGLDLLRRGANTYKVGVRERDPRVRAGLPEFDRHRPRLAARRRQPDVRHVDLEQPRPAPRPPRDRAPQRSTSSSAR